MNGTLFNELLVSVKEAGAIKRNEVLPSREMELKMNTEETQVRSECPSYDTCHDEGYDYGYDTGFSDGHSEGYDYGYNQGLEEGRQEVDEDDLTVDLSTVREMLVMLHEESLDVEPLMINETHVCNTTLQKCPFLVTINYKDANRCFCAYLNSSLDDSYYGNALLALNKCPLKELL